jgi:hypothetical protein
LRFHPSRQVGYVILSNVNAILSGGDNYESARSDIYRVQDALVSILDPTLVIRYRTLEVLIFITAGSVWAYFMRKKPRIVTTLGVVWSVFGGVWISKSIPVGLGAMGWDQSGESPSSPFRNRCLIGYDEFYSPEEADQQAHQPDAA